MDIDRIMRENLLRLIKARGLSQRGIALMSGVDPVYMNQICTGKKGLGKNVMQRICNALNIDPIEFLMKVDTPVIADKKELNICKRMRTYPELANEIDVISEALTISYCKRAKVQYLPIREKKKDTPIRHKAGG